MIHLGTYTGCDYFSNTTLCPVVACVRLYKHALLHVAEAQHSTDLGDWLMH